MEWPNRNDFAGGDGVLDEDALLEAVGRYPADDTARLVYADWLDEHGHPERAAFLRLEVRLRRPESRAAGWFALGRAFLLASRVVPDDWRERVSRPRLAGTTWRTVSVDGEDAARDERLEFRDGGSLVYLESDVGWDDETDELVESRTVEQSPGTWRQFGPRVVVTINDFSVSLGTVVGDTLTLRGRPLAGYDPAFLWRWELARVPGPDCIPDAR